MHGVLNRMRSSVLLLGLLLTGCRPAQSNVPAIPEAAATLRVHGCVTVDGAPAATAVVRARTRDGATSEVPLDARQCFRIEGAVGGLSQLHVSAPGRGWVIQPLLPVAGVLDGEVPLPPPSQSAVMKFRGDDRVARLAAATGWYANVLRGAPTREHLQAVGERWRREADRAVRETFGVIYLALARTPGAPVDAVDLKIVRAAIAAAGPEHMAWSVDMEAVILAGMAGDVDRAFLRRVLEQHRDPQVYGAAAYVLAGESTNAGDAGGVRAVLASLRARGTSSIFATMTYQLDPDDMVAEGKVLPPFRLRRLGEQSTVDSEALRGKVVLLHVWATWCQPCIAELPALAALYERHAAEGLEIVSLSIDEDPRVVEAFRRERHAMPWIHVWEPPDVAVALRKQYQVSDSTKTIVIGRDGVVVAEDLHPSHPQFAARLVGALAVPVP